MASLRRLGAVGSVKLSFSAGLSAYLEDRLPGIYTHVFFLKTPPPPGIYKHFSGSEDQPTPVYSNPPPLL